MNDPRPEQFERALRIPPTAKPDCNRPREATLDSLGIARPFAQEADDAVRAADIDVLEPTTCRLMQQPPATIVRDHDADLRAGEVALDIEEVSPPIVRRSGSGHPREMGLRADAHPITRASRPPSQALHPGCCKSTVQSTTTAIITWRNLTLCQGQFVLFFGSTCKPLFCMHFSGQVIRKYP